jgi:hypothetical protein
VCAVSLMCSDCGRFDSFLRFMKETYIRIVLPDVEVRIFPVNEIQKDYITKELSDLVASPKYANLLGEVIVKAKEELENKIARASN